MNVQWPEDWPETERRTVDAAYGAQRDCLCQIRRGCSDHCITVTNSEYCADCEIAHLQGRPCH